MVLFVLSCFTGSFPSLRQTLIWSAKNVQVSSWKKVVIALPTDLDEYRVLLEGEYNKTSHYWSRNYVTVDNLELRSCSMKGKLLHTTFLLVTRYLKNAGIHCGVNRTPGDAQ